MYRVSKNYKVSKIKRLASGYIGLMFDEKCVDDNPFTRVKEAEREHNEHVHAKQMEFVSFVSMQLE